MNWFEIHWVCSTCADCVRMRKMIRRSVGRQRTTVVLDVTRFYPGMLQAAKWENAMLAARRENSEGSEPALPSSKDCVLPNARQSKLSITDRSRLRQQFGKKDTSDESRQFSSSKPTSGNGGHFLRSERFNNFLQSAAKKRGWKSDRWLTAAEASQDQLWPSRGATGILIRAVSKRTRRPYTMELFNLDQLVDPKNYRNTYPTTGEDSVEYDISSSAEQSGEIDAKTATKDGVELEPECLRGLQRA